MCGVSVCVCMLVFLRLVVHMTFSIRLELTDCMMSEKEVLDLVGKLPKLNVRLCSHNFPFSHRLVELHDL